VSLEVAKLLEEAGFNWGCREYYPTNFLTNRYKEYAKPTLDVAQRWLREVKNISVDISSTCYSGWEYIIRKINQLNHKDNTILALTACRFYTYEEALEAGIKKALEIILEKGE
jgi:hypothetical protein